MRHTPVPCPTFWRAGRRCCCDESLVSRPQNLCGTSAPDGLVSWVALSAAPRSGTRSAKEGLGGPSHPTGSWICASCSPEESQLPGAARQFLERAQFYLRLIRDDITDRCFMNQRQDVGIVFTRSVRLCRSWSGLLLRVKGVLRKRVETSILILVRYCMWWYLPRSVFWLNFSH